MSSTPASGAAPTDKLTLEIWTDGRISPDEALTLSAAILRHYLDVIVNFDENIVEFQDTEKTIDPAPLSERWWPAR